MLLQALSTSLVRCLRSKASFFLIIFWFAAFSALRSLAMRPTSLRSLKWILVRALAVAVDARDLSSDIMFARSPSDW